MGEKETREEREILSARESDELKFKREHDYENLAMIPSIKNGLDDIKETLRICDVPGMRKDVDWLKTFFWVAVTAIATEAAGIVSLAFAYVFRRR